jgi:hypothetical protein
VSHGSAAAWSFEMVQGDGRWLVGTRRSFFGLFRSRATASSVADQNSAKGMRRASIPPPGPSRRAEELLRAATGHECVL